MRFTAPPPFYQSTLPLRLRVVAGRFVVDFVWHLESDHESEDMRTMRTSSSIVLACLGFHLGAASCHPPLSRQPQLGAASIPPAPQPARPPGRRPHLYGCGGRAAAAAAACADTYAPAHPGSLRALLCVRAARRLHAPASCRVTAARAVGTGCAGKLAHLQQPRACHATVAPLAAATEKGWEGRPNLSQRRLTLAPNPGPCA